MLLAPAKTPRPIVDRLHAEMAHIMADAGTREKIAGIGLIPNPPMSVEEMQAYIRSERVKWGGLVKQLGLEGSQ
jgi:tripartite-type tricarboxylate transporter receptor subunit TctC